jgi:uncharacterized delta-60 repeat protein
MKHFITLFSVLLIFVLPEVGIAQEWVARYDGPNNGSDWSMAIAVDVTGNVYVTGGSRGVGTDDDYATIKYDDAGVEQWVSRYNGPGGAVDYANAIVVDNTGNVYVTGYSAGSGTAYDYATVKYNASGTEQWVERYNGPGNNWDWAYAIAADNEGNVYVSGHSEGSGTFQDYATVKYDSAGTVGWVARYNGPGDSIDCATAIAVDEAGNVYVAGYSEGSGTGQDYATVKYNSSGVEQWAARYDGPASGMDRAAALALDDDGNIYVTGRSAGSGTSNDYATVKYNSAGVEQWVSRYNAPGNNSDRASAIAVDDTGNVYVTGGSVSATADNDYATVMYNSSGVEQWVARYDGPNNDFDWPYAIALDGMGNSYVAGGSYGVGTYEDYATVKYDPSGTEQWVERYNGPGNHWDVARAMFVDGAGNIYVTGYSGGTGTGDDYATLKYASTGVEEQRIVELTGKYLHATIISGPIILPMGTSCRLRDITGRVVVPELVRQGIYFVEIDGEIVQKLVKID